MWIIFSFLCWVPLTGMCPLWKNLIGPYPHGWCTFLFTVNDSFYTRRHRTMESCLFAGTSKVPWEHRGIHSGGSYDRLSCTLKAWEVSEATGTNRCSEV